MLYLSSALERIMPIDMESLYECLESPSKQGYEIEYFWISGISLVIIVFFGVMGNISCLLVLVQRLFRKKIFYNLLMVMAGFDTLFIVSYGVKIGYQSMACRENFIKEVGRITYLFLNVGLTGSIYTTVAVSIERYLNICSPSYHKQCYNRIWIYIIFILIVTLTFNVPIFFEYHYHILNGTLVAEEFSWAKSETYKTYYHLWAALFIDSIIPFLALLLLNGAILIRLNRSCREKLDLTKSNDDSRKTSTRILFSIVGLFMICHTPCVVWKVLWHLGCINCTTTEVSDFRRKWYFITPIKKLFLVINSSLNFVLYCIMGTRFREEFVRLISLSNIK